MLINKKKETSHVRFVSYTSKPMCLCDGILTLEIDGEIQIFGDNDWYGNQYGQRFWSSGGSCGFTNDGREYCYTGEWIIDASELPEELQKYAEEIDEVFNRNVEYGCCGGCI